MVGKKRRVAQGRAEQASKQTKDKEMGQRMQMPGNGR
jgi:hypothetical protein